MGRELYDIIDKLETYVIQSKKVPLAHKVIVRDTELYAIIDELRSAIPEEIKASRRLLQEKERILSQAKNDAAKVLDEARTEADTIMRNELLNRQIDEQVSVLLHQAEDNAHQLRQDADIYATDTLRRLHEQLIDMETDVSRTILSIEKGLEQLEAADQHSVHSGTTSEVLEMINSGEFSHKASD